jgi:vitamin B12 transporter
VARWIVLLVLLPLTVTGAFAQSVITGSVVDETGAAIRGAHLTIRDAAGKVALSSTSDSAGRFTIRGLAAGTYVAAIEVRSFMPDSAPVTVPITGNPEALHFVLKAVGFAEMVVVTARRADARRAEIPQALEVVDSADIERTVAADLTDVLKKNAGVDVVQYSGVLSGIGIRGFRPQFSGINKRSLLLIDGRPSGITNLATLLLDNVDRIEVLKGAGSAVYGSSAMGGVVNVITRHSTGKIGGSLRAGAASFGGAELAGRIGGSLSKRIDFDLTGNTFNQRHDMRMGNGNVRPATSFKTYDTNVRAGVDVGAGWRIDGRLNDYRGLGIMSPGDLASGVNSQGSKDIAHASQDMRVNGRAGKHTVTVNGYHARENSNFTTVTSSSLEDQPFLPFLAFESELAWAGAQLRDSWNWSRSNALLAGVDYEKVTSVSRSFARSGDRVAPFSADSHKRTAGIYAEHTTQLRGGRTIVSLGGRLDRISTETVDTPLKTNFRPSETTLSVFSPSVGMTHEIGRGLRVHFAAGRAFIPAEAVMLTGFTVTTVGARTQINQGNPDLRPERSTSFDVGTAWTGSTARFDLTVFRTVVRDRFISNVTISSPEPPAPIVLSVVNGLDARISGVDAEFDQRVGAGVGTFVNVTHYFNRREQLAGGVEQDILNVAKSTIRAGVDIDVGPVSARLGGRYVRGRKDNDFNRPGFPVIDNDNFAVVDASATYRVARQHAVLLSINNLFDAYYYEKLGFPLQGVSFKLSYRFGF